MHRDLVKPAERIAPPKRPPKPRIPLTDRAFEYTKAEGGSAVLNDWKRRRIEEGTWRGQEYTNGPTT